MFSGKGVLKICSKFTGERLYQSVISIKLQSNFNEIALWYGCSPVNLLHIFKTHFYKKHLGRATSSNFKIQIPLASGVLQKIFFQKHCSAMSLLPVFILKDEQNYFSTSSANLVASNFVETLQAATSKSKECHQK